MACDSLLQTEMVLLRSFIAIALLNIVGCGQSDWGELHGKVMLSGQPAGPGAISLKPSTGSVIAIGQVKEDGSYSIISSGRRSGAKVGEYQVGIYDDDDPESTGPMPKKKFPARYADPATSGLTVTVEPGTNERNFELAP
jgi:hypothetical protein